MTITIYHNPSCGTSRNTLAMIRQSYAYSGAQAPGRHGPDHQLPHPGWRLRAHSVWIWLCLPRDGALSNQEG